MSHPLVSVITPVYNGATFIAECIRSVQRQNYAAFNYTIVDNCSRDSTAEIVRSVIDGDPRMRLVTNTEFVPMVANWNRAIGSVDPQAKYCKPLMADDWLAPRCLSALVSAAEQQNGVGLVCCYAFNGRDVLWDGFPFSGTPAQLVSFARGSDVARSGLLGGPYVFGTPSSQLLRMDIVRSRQPFYDESNIHADHASCYDILTESDFAFVHEVLTLNRVHEASQTASAEKNDAMVLGSLAALARFGPRFLGTDEYEARIEQRLERYYRMLGRNALRMRDRSFWSLHRRRMTEIGLPISTPKVGAAASHWMAWQPLQLP